MKRAASVLLLMAVLLFYTVSSVSAGLINDAINLAAGELVMDQQGDGSWGEQGFTGESVIGLSHAYQLTGTSAYSTAAQGGGSYILSDAGYNSSSGTYTYGPFASGAYALSRLSEVSGNPASNTWRTALEDFYTQVSGSTGGTQGYVDSWSTQEDSSAVYDIARHTMAASYVGIDQSIWRSGLISTLAEVDDTDEAPVMGLGAAVWGLAQTGPMDSTIVSTDPGSHFQNVSLAQLPDMLAGHQATDGSFYTCFDHSFDYGYTETSAIASLGLISADENVSGLDYDDEIFDARVVLAGGVDQTGQVYWKIGDNTEVQRDFLAGETLEVVPEPATLSLMGIGILFLGRYRKRKGKKSWSSGMNI